MNIINVENITKSYTGRKLFSKASFYVQENEKIGIIGINGTGKSTLLKIVAGDEEPDEGTVTTANHIVINYLPQNPEFDPDETALEHVMSRVVTSQLDEDMRWSIESDAKSLLMKLDITDMTQKTGELSGGQRQRIGIARALAVNPDFIVCDEPISALDVSIQAQVINLLEQLQRERGLTYLFIAHDLSMVKHISDRIGVMYLGSLVELADSEELFENPMHPYTKALLSAIPIPDPDIEKNRQRIMLEGTLPNPIDLGEECKFCSRCPVCKDSCHKSQPKLVEVKPGHFVACSQCAE